MNKGPTSLIDDDMLVKIETPSDISSILRAYCHFVEGRTTVAVPALKHTQRDTVCYIS